MESTVRENGCRLPADTFSLVLSSIPDSYNLRNILNLWINSCSFHLQRFDDRHPRGIISCRCQNQRRVVPSGLPEGFRFGRARWGDTGALLSKPGYGRLNSCFRGAPLRLWRTHAALMDGPSATDELRTSSGRERSSDKVTCPCAAGVLSVVSDDT